MHPALIAVGSFLTGGVGWTLTEYLVHRFGAHEGKNRTPFQREHLAHHSIPGYFAPTHQKLITAVAVGLPMATISIAVTGVLRGACFTAGYLIVYGAYEWFHRRIHVKPPTGPVTRYLYKHHLMHHFHDARRNHGVTSPLWDFVFGTATVPGVVRVPRRLGPDWVFDEDGAVLPRFAADYERAGSRGPAQPAPKPAPGEAAQA